MKVDQASFKIQQVPNDIVMCHVLMRNQPIKSMIHMQLEDNKVFMLLKFKVVQIHLSRLVLKKLKGTLNNDISLYGSNISSNITF